MLIYWFRPYPNIGRLNQMVVSRSLACLRLTCSQNVRQMAYRRTLIQYMGTRVSSCKFHSPIFHTQDEHACVICMHVEYTDQLTVWVNHESVKMCECSHGCKLSYGSSLTPLITLIPVRLHAHFMLHVLFYRSKLDFIPLFKVVTIF